jgi:hypothetical protein
MALLKRHAHVPYDTRHVLYKHASQEPSTQPASLTEERPGFESSHVDQGTAYHDNIQTIILDTTGGCSSEPTATVKRLPQQQINCRRLSLAVTTAKAKPRKPKAQKV